MALARLLGWRVFHPFNSRRSEPGWPDLSLVKPPRIVFVEVKTDTGRLSAAQRTWLAALQQVEQVAVRVWRPGDWPEIEALLKGAERSV